MNEVLRAMREEAYRREPGKPYRQGVAEIVGLRNHLTSLVISSELRQDGLLTNPAARAVFAENLRPVEDQSFQGAVIREVLAKLQIGSLRGLTTEQIAECRRASGGFRDLLDQSLLAVARGVDPVITPEATAEELVGRYNEAVSRYASRRVGPEIAEDVMWDVLGVTIPPTMYLKYGLKAFRWRKVANELRPFLMLIQLERALNRHANQR